MRGLVDTITDRAKNALLEHEESFAMAYDQDEAEAIDTVCRASNPRPINQGSVSDQTMFLSRRSACIMLSPLSNARSCS